MERLETKVDSKTKQLKVQVHHALDLKKGHQYLMGLFLFRAARIRCIQIEVFN